MNKDEARRNIANHQRRIVELQRQQPAAHVMKALTHCGCIPSSQAAVQVAALLKIKR